MSTISFETFYSTEINEITLEQALKMHYELNPQFTPWDKYDTFEASRLIKAHDISHVIFGCDTGYGGEFQVQTWVKYGAKLNISPLQMPKYLFNKDLFQIVLPPKLIQYSLTHRKEFREYSKLIKLQAAKMTRKWIYFEEKAYMNKIVGDIRGEYNIDLIKF